MYLRSTRTTKRCPACGLTKPIDQFHRDRSRPDGAMWACAQCQNAQQTRYRATHHTPAPAQLVPPNHKRCKTCQEVKPLDAFPPSKRTTDGRFGTCRACKNAHNCAVYANRAKPVYQPSNRTTKRCPICGLTKPIADFNRNRTRPDGYASACRTCANAKHATYMAARRALKPTPETLPTGTKRCTHCQQIKPLDAFTPRKHNPDGHAGCCKACRNARQRAAYAKDPARYLTAKQRWYDAHPTYLADYNRRKREQNRNDPNYAPDAFYRRYKPRLHAYKAKWDTRYKERKVAHQAVARAVRSGRLTKLQACQRCGATGRIEGHHPDYAQPLQVIWLCVKCHRRQTAADNRRKKRLTASAATDAHRRT